MRNKKIDKFDSGNFLLYKFIFIRLSLIFLVIAAVIFSVIKLKPLFFPDNSVHVLYKYWEENDVQKVYEVSGAILEDNPFQNIALTFRGYSAFKLALSQTENSTEVQTLLDEAINNLRVSLELSGKNKQAQTFYVLGLTYFYKNKLSSYYYYADLAVKYLEMAKNSGYSSKDIPELLGLSYADLGMTDKSIQAFTQALLVHESDTLLFNIAKQYYKAGQGNTAKQYLIRVLDTSNDDEIKINSQNILGKIYLQEGNYAEAKKEFLSILEKNENFADAHYGLGVLYEKEGNKAKARSELRKCLRLQVNHKDAIEKLAAIK